jgi:DNA mismatch repair protein MutS
MIAVGDLAWTRREAVFLLPARTAAAARIPAVARGGNKTDPTSQPLGETSLPRSLYRDEPRSRTLPEVQSGVADMTDARKSNVIGLDPARLPAHPADPSASERRQRAAFYSVLFENPEDRTGDDTLQPPNFFADLNCDQIVDAVTAGREAYNLKPFLYGCLQRVGAIRYRHEVMQDLEQPAVYEHVTVFAEKMRDVRDYLLKVQKAFYKEQKQAWFLDAVEIYCAAVKSFAASLSDSGLHSRGFLAFRTYMVGYARSSHFHSLLAAMQQLRAELAKVEYCVLIKSGGFTVRKYDDEADYSAEVEETFAKFKQGAVKDYRVKFSASNDMNHIEAKILEFVAKLYPEVFDPLEDFCSKNTNFIDRTIAVFDREVQFYVAFLEYIGPLRRVQLPFCYPFVSQTSREIHDYEGFDVALAHKLLKENSSVVCNDFYLRGSERILVVSGPNQGGKTTFARAFGQMHYLASIGYPVPGREAQLFLFDRLFTHFEKEEKVENLRGKLEDDLLRIHHILSQATPRSIIIMNEIFTSTTVKDEIFLSEKIMEKIIELGLLCVWVTFVDELASFGPQTVSMISTVAPENPALRTFKILRRPADGLAYAMAIAEKYRLTYDSIRERIGP